MPIDPLGRRNHGSESGTGIVCASEGDLSSPIRYNSSARTRRPGRSDFSFGSQNDESALPRCRIRRSVCWRVRVELGRL